MKRPPHEQIRVLAEIIAILLAHIGGRRTMSCFELAECQRAIDRILKD